VQALDALAVGELAMRLGAGRTQIGERVDPSVGVYLHKKPGERVARGELLAELHVRGAAGAAELTQLMAAYRIGPHRPRIPALVIERIAR
jgi:thymidine phosphorylase